MPNRIPEYYSRGDFPAEGLPRVPMDIAQAPGAAMARGGEEIERLGLSQVSKLKHGEDLNYIIDSMNKASQEYDAYDQQARTQTSKGAKDFTRQTADWWNNTVQSAVTNAPSPEAKLAVKEHLSRMQMQAVGQATTFEAQQRLKYFGDNLNSALENSYVRAYRNPDQAPAIEAETSGMIAGAASPGAGWLNPDRAGEATELNREKLYTSAFQGLIDRDPARAFSEIRSGAWDSKLSKDSLISLQAKAEAAADRQGRVGLSLLSQKMKDNLSSIENVGVPIPGVMEQVAALKPEAALEYADEVRKSKTYYDTMKAIEFLPTPDARQKLEALAPVPGMEGYEGNLKLYQSVLNFLEKRDKVISDDPAAWAMRAPGVKGFDQVLAQEDSLGVPDEKKRALPNRSAADLVAKFDAAPAQDRVNMIYSWKKEAGTSWPIVLRDLVRQKMSPENEVLIAVHDLPWAPTVLPVISEAIRQGEPELKKNLPPESVKTLEDAVRDEMSEWRETIMKGDYTGARTTWANGIESAVSLTALVYLQRGMKPGEAAERAVKEIVSDRYSKITDSYRVPLGVDAGKVADYSLKSMQDLRSLDFIPHGTMKEGLSSEQLKADYLNAVARKGYWTNNEDETGLVLMDPLGLPVLVKDARGNSRRYEFSFDEAEKYKAPEEIRPLFDLNSALEKDKSYYDESVRPVKSPHKDNVYLAAAQYGVDPSLAMLVHLAEWDPKNNVSPRGAIGPMQLMPGTARDMGVDPNDPVQNVYGGVKYLKTLLSRYRGDEARALVAYNWGPAHADAWDGTLASLPAETRTYLKKILTA